MNLLVHTRRSPYLVLSAILESNAKLKPSREWRESRSRLGLETKSTETLGLVSDSYIIQRLVSSRSRLGGNILSQSHLGLVSETKYWVSLVSVSSRRLNFYSVSYRSRLALVCLFLKKLCSIVGIFVHKLMFFSRSRDNRYRDSRSRTIFRGLSCLGLVSELKNKHSLVSVSCKYL